MAEVMVTIKYANRISPRVYRVSGEDFNAVKDAVKALVGRYNGASKTWSINAAALKALRAQYQVEPSDISADPAHGVVSFRATDEIIFVIKAAAQGGYVHRPELVWDRTLEIARDLQAAYNRGDEEFAAVLGDLYAANGTTIVIPAD